MNARIHERGSGLAPATLLTLGVPLLVLVLLVGWLAYERAEFAPRSFTDVGSTLVASGLTVCSHVDAPNPAVPGSAASRSYTLALDCASGQTAELLVDRFADAGTRDAAVRAHEVQVRPRGSGVAYTWGDLTLLVRGGGDRAVTDRAERALVAAGAR